MTLVMPDELFDAQLVRALAHARHGGADVGECVETGRRIARADPDRWFDEWFATAARVELTAEVSAQAGRRASARDAYPAAAGSRSARAHGMELRRLHRSQSSNGGTPARGAPVTWFVRPAFGIRPRSEHESAQESGAEWVQPTLTRL
jgi:hypothetical protein